MRMSSMNTDGEEQPVVLDASSTGPSRFTGDMGDRQGAPSLFSIAVAFSLVISYSCAVLVTQA